MISPAEIAVLALAGYRGTQLAVHDSILDPVRRRVDAWHQKNTDSGARSALVVLISCIYCSGWWVVGALLLAWLLWPQSAVVVHGIEWLAVAGAAVLLNRWDDSRKEI
ncbi:DUF1360 domain-containing protein [Streptomyces roseifaciens]